MTIPSFICSDTSTAWWIKHSTGKEWRAEHWKGSRALERNRAEHSKGTEQSTGKKQSSASTALKRNRAEHWKGKAYSSTGKAEHWKETEHSTGAEHRTGSSTFVYTMIVIAFIIVTDRKNQVQTQVCNWLDLRQSEKKEVVQKSRLSGWIRKNRKKSSNIWWS